MLDTDNLILSPRHCLYGHIPSFTRDRAFPARGYWQCECGIRTPGDEATIEGCVRDLQIWNRAFTPKSTDN